MPGFTDLDEEVPYRSIPTAPPPGDEPDIDEEEYSTLIRVKKILDESVEELKMDVTRMDATDLQKLQGQILGKQEAYAILDPIKQAIDSAIETVEAKRKGK